MSFQIGKGFGKCEEEIEEREKEMETREDTAELEKIFLEVEKVTVLKETKE